MALSGLYVVNGSSVPRQPDGCDVDAIALPQVVSWNVGVPGTYVFINSVQGKDTVTAAVTVYKDNTKTVAVAQRTYQFVADMNGANFIKQAYDYMKTLPQFAGFTDVLEVGQTA